MRRPFRPDRPGRVLVMGILNVTPDSFSDGGKFLDKRSAVKRALEIIAEGADIIDVGGESARPGARAVGVKEELCRVIPVISSIAEKARVPISVDTRNSAVAEAALKAGASIVNDISGLNHDRNMAGVISRHKAAVILMHMKGEPGNMQRDPRYKDVVKDIITYLKKSIDVCRSAGVPRENIVIDPGIGFGKTLRHNLEILNRLAELKRLGHPVCIGTSRKSFIGKALGIENAGDRLAGSIATSVIAVMNGAGLIRAHDVRETVQAAAMADLIMKAGAN